jgi:SecD/SecF fusion protein
VLFVTVDMNYGIDFKGGSLIEVQSKQGPADIGDIRARLSELNIGEVQVQQFGAPTDVLIRVGAQDAGENGEQTVVTKVRDELQNDYDFRRVEVVGPTVSGELAKQGTIGMLVALVGILLYIWFRFEWQFAIGAIVATVHDVVMTIGFFVISGIEFNQSSIAAMLTIVGYSLNDTIVVYDRVREDLRKYKKMPLPQLLNNAINETLSRTTLTSVTTILALLALVFFGGEVIRSFTAAMLFGVVFGTYSSIFIAAPLLILFRLRPGGAEDEKAEKPVVTGKALAT